MKSFLPALALLVFCQLQAAAQISCRLLCFERAKDGTAVLVAAGADGEAVDCPLPLGMPSPPVPLPAKDGVIEFRKSPADPAPAAVARVPAGTNRVFILFVPQGEKGDRLHETVVIEDSPKGFPQDGCVVLNLYQRNVRFVIGEHKVMLPPGRTAPLARPAERDDFNMSAVVFQFETGETWRTASESKIRFAEGQRHLFVTFVDPATKRPRLRSFRIGV